MTFAWPHLLWLLFVPPVLLVAEILRRRAHVTQAHPKMLHAEAGSRDLTLVPIVSTPSRVRPWLCLGFMLCIGALSRPQWGRTEEPVFDQAREIIIAIDLSRSMLAQDIKPSRLDRAKLLTQSLLEKLAGERVGLVTFSGTAFLQSPLSSDYEILREFLPALNPDFLPEGGTNYRALIDTSLAAFGSTAAADRFLIVLSDGEATEDNWKDRVQELKTKGIRVIGLGVGSPGGAMIPDGNGSFVKDERGAVVLSKLEPSTLQELAKETNGTYRDASSWLDLASVLSATVETGQKGKFLEKNTVRLVERFQWPLAFGLWCLLVSFCYEFPVRPRPREIKIRGKAESAGTAAPKAAATVAAALLCLAAIHGATSANAEEPAAPAPPALSKIVARLSAQDARSARDWVEMGNETVLWGQRIKSESRPVPPGPVRDALAAVELGSALDPKATDWPKLREDLEALLKAPEDKKQDQQQNKNQRDNQQNKDQQQQQQQQQQQNQDQKNQNQQNKDQQQQQDQQDQQQKKDQQQDQSNQKPTPPDPDKKGESAFGDMKSPPKPPPPPHDTQKVGGAPEKKNENAQPTDPSLALPLQKLDQLRNQDSPAELFQLMDADKKPTPKKSGKDW